MEHNLGKKKAQPFIEGREEVRFLGRRRSSVQWEVACAPRRCRSRLPALLFPADKGRSGRTLPGFGSGGKVRCHPWAKARKFNL